jgi:hypothetical protein
MKHQKQEENNTTEEQLSLTNVVPANTSDVVSLLPNVLQI